MAKTSKSTEVVSTTVYFPIPLREDLEALAARRFSTISQIIRFACFEAVEHDKRARGISRAPIPGNAMSGSPEAA